MKNEEIYSTAFLIDLKSNPEHLIKFYGHFSLSNNVFEIYILAHAIYKGLYVNCS